MTRAREVIDSELRLVAAVRETCREAGGPLPDVAVADELLDERSASTAISDVTGGGPKNRP